jgi:opacity protein-like surface antigen
MRLVTPTLLALALLSGAFPAFAADLAKEAPSATAQIAAFQWNGTYAGLSIGGATYDQNHYVTVGGFVGVNSEITQGVVAGAELQASAYFRNGSDYSGIDLLALGRLGAVLNDVVLAYGLAGGGTVDGYAGYAIGAGLEYAATEQVSLRLEAQRLGIFDDNDPFAKIGMGALFHFN